MDQRQRIATQRALMREAFGKIDAATEFFGTETGAVAGDDPGFAEWERKVAEFKAWIWEASPVA